jgi:hypothetical protein
MRKNVKKDIFSNIYKKTSNSDPATQINEDPCGSRSATLVENPPLHLCLYIHVNQF